MLSLGLREPHISLPGGVLPRFCQWKALRSPAEQEGDRTCFSPSVCSFCQISLGKSLSSPTPLVHLSGSSMHFWGQPQGCPWWPASALPLDSAPVRPSAVGSSERLKQHHRLGSAPSSEVRVRLLPAPLPSSRFLGPPSPLAPAARAAEAASYGYSLCGTAVLPSGRLPSPSCAYSPSPLMEFSRLIYRVSLLFPDWALTNWYLFISSSLEGARSEQNHHRARKHRLPKAFLVEGNSAPLCRPR